MKRPMLYWAVMLLLGEVISRILPEALSIIVCVLLCILIYGLKNAYFNDNRTLLYVGVIFYSLGFICNLNYEKKLSLCEYQENDEISFSGIVIDSYKKYDGRYRVRTNFVDGVRLHTYVIIETQEDLMLGYRIEGKGEYEPFTNATNYGEFDRKSFELSRGNMLFLKKVHISASKRTILIIIDYLRRVNDHICELFDKWLPEDKASIAKAMVMGDKTDIDNDIRQLYQRSGIAHIIAISGLHIAMFGGTIYHLLRKLSGSFSFAAILGITFIITYGILTGLSGATVRAMIMLILAIIAEVIGRKYDGITAITTALILMLVWNPNSLYQVGFLLSFGAVLGISVILPVIKEVVPERFFKKAVMGKLINGLLLSISVQLATLPVILYYFYEAPVYGIILNIIVVPLMSILLLFLVMLVIGGYFSSILAGISTFIVSLILDTYEMLCKLTDCLPFHIFHAGRPNVLLVLIYYQAVALLLFALHNRKRNVAVFSGIMMIALFAIVDHGGEVMVNIFDVGQGDGIYIRTQANENILIDGGSSTKKNVGEYIIKNGLKYYGCDQIDYMIITHSDSDHFSGAMELLNDGSVSVENLVLPRILSPDDEYISLEAAAGDKGCKIYYISCGDELSVDGVTFHCLNPGKILTTDKNQNSIVLWMQYDRFDMLLTADIDNTIEEKVVKDQFFCAQLKRNNRIEVLKVAHHGSATSSSADFINKVGAPVSVISVGKKNRYGHPSMDVVDRLRASGSSIYMTKDDGAITIRTDGKSYRIDTFIKEN